MDFSTIINFNDFATLVPLVTGSIIAGLILGVVSGLIGPMIHARDLAFAVHGTSSCPLPEPRWRCTSGRQ